MVLRWLFRNFASMKIFSTENIRNIDRITIDQEGISSMELIRRVADGVAGEITSRWRPTKPTVIFAGAGNNGADALMVAKRLYETGFAPQVYLLNIHGNSLSRDCRQCKDELLASGFQGLNEVTGSFNFPDLTRDHLIVDGLFGTGLREPLSGGYTTLVEYINESGATIVSIDIPSGMFGDWNVRTLSRYVVHASLTVAVQFPRIAFFLADNAPCVGEWKTIDIGLSPKAINETLTKFFFIEAEDVRRVLLPRAKFSSKADYGSALLIAGCYGMMGAAVMAAKGALRAGVGKLTVHSPRCGFNVIQSTVPQALFDPDRHDILVSDMTPRHGFNAIGVGPGLGTNDATQGALETLIKTIKRPMVLDADALNIISKVPSLVDHIPVGSILTPHDGEFDRLFGPQASAESRLLRAIEVSARYKIIIVLKGYRTATVRPDGKIFFNSSGGPAMATGGSGDVLTGVITSLLAQGYKPETAAVAGVYIHGLAGDIAAAEQGVYGTTAVDIAECVGKAIMKILNY